MNPVLQQMLTPGDITAYGAGLVVVGLSIWISPKLYRKPVEFRRVLAAALREKGEEIRAQKVDELTERFVKRVPIYGRIMVGLGLVIALYGIARR